jgi:ribosomal-protein-alanine N-acetyltransferase
MQLSFNFSPFPEMETERLTLRQLHWDDVQEVYYLRAHPEVMKYIGIPLASSIADANEYIEKVMTLMAKKEGIWWAISIKGYPKLVGVIAYRSFLKEHYRGELSYAMHPDLQGRGLMQEALALILDYGFNKIGLHSVEANVDKENAASIRLLERNNFVKEAHFKENYYFDSKFIDSVIYSLIKPTKQ